MFTAATGRINSLSVEARVPTAPAERRAVAQDGDGKRTVSPTVAIWGGVGGYGHSSNPANGEAGASLWSWKLLRLPAWRSGTSRAEPA